MVTRPTPTPVIDPVACVHGASPMAGCADCIAACPHQALAYAGGAVRLDAGRCRGCGACVAACPARAITQTPPPPAPLREGATIIAVCARHPAAQGRPAPRCIHATGPARLAEWVLSGVTRIACGTGDCATCPDAPAARLADGVAMVAPLARAAGLAAPQIAPATPAQLALWARRAEDGPEPRRRALLRALAAPVIDEAPPEAPALARLQARMPPEAPRAFVPEIAAAACTGCDACIRICPEAALTLINEPPGGARYHVATDRCTGCLLCEDVCTNSAIEVDAMIAPPPDLALHSFRCAACGRDAHVPAAGPHAGAALCPVCAATGHHKKLFQVLP